MSTHDAPEIRQEEIEPFLRRLISIPSVTGSEHRIAEYFSHFFSKHNFDVQIIPTEGVGPSVVARCVSGRGPNLLLYGHLDTVEPVDGWRYPLFKPRKVKGYMYGLGSWDMKAGLSALSLAAAKLSKQRFNGVLTVALASDEELYSRGFHAFHEKDVFRGVQAAISAEPTGLNRLEVGRRGRVVFEVNVKGRAGHAANPAKSVDAVKAAARVVLGLDRLRFKRWGPIRGSAAVLSIEGGTDFLTVPDRCRIRVDRHLVLGESRQMAHKQLKELAKDVEGDARIEVRLFRRRTPFPEPYEIPRTEPIIRIMEETCLRVRGRKPRRSFGLSVADDNYLVVEAGVPTVTFGPDGENYHGPNECVHLPSVVDAANIYLQASALFFESFRQRH
ncbi:MAG: M20 family metallopeptidase [Candidatus Bathyarchaeia archaeon]